MFVALCSVHPPQTELGPSPWTQLPVALDGELTDRQLMSSVDGQGQILCTPIVCVMLVVLVNNALPNHF